MSQKTVPGKIPTPFNYTEKIRKNDVSEIFNFSMKPVNTSESTTIGIKEILKKSNRYPKISVSEIIDYWALPIRRAFNTNLTPPDTESLKNLAKYLGLKEPMSVYEGIALIITYYYGEAGKGYLLSFNRALNWAKVLVDLSGTRPVNEPHQSEKFRFSFLTGLIRKIEEIISKSGEKSG